MDIAPGPGRWPLSAPATAMLRDPRTPPDELLRLALRELAVRGAVRVQLHEQSGRRKAQVRLLPGEVDAAGLPGPLAVLAGALLPHVDPGGTPAHRAVQQASGWRADLAARVRTAARQELQAAGLMVPARGRLLGVVPVTRWQLTGSGRAWAASAAGAATAATGVLPAAGLLLALDRDVQRRLRDAAGSDGDAAAGWVDADGLDAVLGEAGAGLDAAADAASGGDGGGGDGGGGGGGD